MLIDATEKFLDRFAKTLAVARETEKPYETKFRVVGLSAEQQRTVALRAALIQKGKKRGGA